MAVFREFVGLLYPKVIFFLKYEFENKKIKNYISIWGTYHRVTKQLKVTFLDSRASSLQLFSDIQLLFLFIDVKFSLCSDFGRKVRNFCFILTGFGELRGSQAPSPPRREKYYAPSPHRTRARFRCRQAATISLLVFESYFNVKNKATVSLKEDCFYCKMNNTPLLLIFHLINSLWRDNFLFVVETIRVRVTTYVCVSSSWNR